MASKSATLNGSAADVSALHRAVRVATHGSIARGITRATVEDDFHHFRVALRFHEGKIVSTETEALRNPFTLCSHAGAQLNDLVGMKLQTTMSAVFRQANARMQCTHQFDIAALAIAAAGRGIRRRSYQALVPDPLAGRRVATLSCDGESKLSWDLFNDTIEGPYPYIGLSVGSGFTDWASTNLLPDDAEAAVLLRRAVFVSRGRMIPKLDHPRPDGGCWVKQPTHAAHATRIAGTQLDFRGKSGFPSAADDEWLELDE